MKYTIMNQVEAAPMTRANYNKYRGRTIPDNENPADEGYVIAYHKGEPDEHISWYPKANFEAISRPCDGMTFGMAIEAMKRGEKVARRGWNGKGMWLSVPLTNGPAEIPYYNVWGKQNGEYAHQNGGTVKVLPYVTMKASDGSIVMGWLASQTDMLAEDWMVVE